MHPQVRPVSTADFDELVASQYRAFGSGGYHEVWFGPDTPSNRARAKNIHIADLATCPHKLWTKVVDADTGRFMAAAQWEVTLRYNPPATTSYPIPDWCEGEEQEMAAYTIRTREKNKSDQIQEGHVFLHILFTDPDCRRQGAASALVQWGCALADHLFLPSWLEASYAGRPLYAKHGFQDISTNSVNTKKWTTGSLLMRRPATLER